MKKISYLLISLLFLALTFYACSGGSKRSISGIATDTSCAVGQTLVGGVCVNSTTTVTLCNQDDPQNNETDTRVMGWGGIDVFKMFSTSCYEDALACDHYSNYDCNSWVDPNDKAPYKVGLGSLGADAFCCGSLNPNCNAPVVSGCAGGIAYTYKFIKCDADLYMLHGMIGTVRQATCDDISQQSYNPLKIGSVVALSIKGSGFFILTPDEDTSMLVQMVVAKSQPAGLPWADVPSVANFLTELSKDCISTLASDSAKEGSFCVLNSTRYGIELDLLY